MSKLVELYPLNLFSLLFFNYTSKQLSESIYHTASKLYCEKNIIQKCYTLLGWDAELPKLHGQIHLVRGSRKVGAIFRIALFTNRWNNQVPEKNRTNMSFHFAWVDPKKTSAFNNIHNFIQAGSSKVNSPTVYASSPLAEITQRWTVPCLSKHTGNLNMGLRWIWTLLTGSGF